MWFKVVLLLIYLCVLFILARLIEVMTHHEQGQLSRRLLDPMALTVPNLKALLEQRGVIYYGLVEKSEFSDLVKASGDVSKEDLEAAIMLQADNSATPIIQFKGGYDFNQQVEDAKDSMWLVEVVANSERQNLVVETWRHVQRKLNKFNVRFGRFDCSKDKSYCRKKNWSTSINSKLVVAIPEHHKEEKVYVRLITYPGHIETESIYKWVRQNLDSHIRSIGSYNTYKTDWLTYKSELNPEVRAIFFSTMATIPMFFSALSVRFPGRVKIGYVNTKTQQGKYLVQNANIGNATSTYLIITAERTYYYGYNRGEILSFHYMEFFLKTLYPSLNDVFMLCIIVVNTLGSFEISLTPGKLTTKIYRLCLCLFKFNVMFTLCWAALLKINKLPLIQTFVHWAIRTIRLITTTSIFSVIRKDVIFYFIHWPLLLFSFLTYLIVTCFIYEKIGYTHPSYSEQRTEALTLSRDTYPGLVNSVVDAPVAENSSDSEQAYDPPNSERDESNPPEAERDDSDPLDAEQQGSDRPDAEHEVSESIFFPVFGQQRSATYTFQLSRSPFQRHVFPSVSSSGIFLDPQVANLFHLQERVPDGYIKRLKTWKYRPDLPREGFEDNDGCTICQEPFVAMEYLVDLPCLHSFHEKCIVPWLTEGKHSCPNCRQPSYIRV
ncbi:hypothetical protein CHS0354_007223 [Potamilus streckersoni]|uniref:RING-type domain-containing protein n=1 Tax=Potamilus streckersoni TaxID=2493646 RepID=A0AAE0VM22_9BIVA|nr:hypothetical protein CHS0354_007223 [Potamilus streckersoni]